MRRSDFGYHIELLGAREWQVRNHAFTALQQAGTATVEALIEGTTHASWRVRRGCADLMDHLADNRCVEPLLGLLHDPIEAVRRLALHALGCQGCKMCPLDVDIVAHLAEVALADSSIRVRRVAVHQLGCQPPDPRTARVLQTILEQATDPKLLAHARWAFRRQQQDPHACPIL